MKPVALHPCGLETMRCDRRDMTLSTGGCGQLWEAAQVKFAAKKLEVWKGITACDTCPVGARSAGREVEAVFQPATALAGERGLAFLRRHLVAGTG